MTPLHGVGWTLNFEMFFYLTFAVALSLPRRIAVPLLSAVLCVAVILGSLLSPSFAPLRYWSDPIILEFVFGMLIALVYRQQRALLPMWARLCLITASAATVWLFAPRMPPSGYRALEWGLPAAMMVAASVLGHQRAWSGLTATIAKKLGDASYSIYLIHPLVGAPIFLLWHDNLGYLGHLDHRVVSVGRFAFMVAGFVFMIVLSMGTYRYLEKPFTAFIRRRLERSGDFDVLPIVGSLPLKARFDAEQIKSRVGDLCLSTLDLWMIVVFMHRLKADAFRSTMHAPQRSDQVRLCATTSLHLLTRSEPSTQHNYNTPDNYNTPAAFP